MTFRDFDTYANKDNEYMTFNQTAKRFPAFTVGSLRWLRFNNCNGFNSCVIKIGRKVLISVEDFKAWIESQQSTTNDNK